ncbi:hypothetical protein JAAARDRAFT_189313 [Jaapia argillacea MUCL 33604]|uniref:SMP-LTD domain-containing protein n=1 Tax=Jaapia argillacea MUCL 33604 TaxID=933084 RepID=A0A067QC88_9AGAM|nr:hypothetical protein JAAARDRAFT_189313 [Jaapia argillacea MUCL 33604]
MPNKLHLTFAQGLILGQISILLLLGLTLKYLFLESSITAFAKFQGNYPFDSCYHNRSTEFKVKYGGLKEEGVEFESAEWFNMLIGQVVQTYRSKLRDDLPGEEGSEIARRRIEDFANKMRPTDVLGPIRIRHVNLGVSAPRLSHARLVLPDELELQAQFEVSYADSVSISLSTTYLLNPPIIRFSRLPVSLSISLLNFSSPITLTAPIPSHPSPTLTLALPPLSPSDSGSTLELNVNSALGRMATIENLPVVRQLVETKIRKAISEYGTLTIVLPDLFKAGG